jgi:hypothetical protein
MFSCGLDRHDLSCGLVARSKSEQAMITIDQMRSGESAYDVIIVCCSSEGLANYWQKRLETGRGAVVGKSAIVRCVFEDWGQGGAGNGLGTLYAYQKACAATAGAEAGGDIKKRVEAGASVALYHTAGKGTRLAPLPGAENNNKPGVKLPSLFKMKVKETANARARPPVFVCLVSL